MANWSKDLIRNILTAIAACVGAILSVFFGG